MPRHGWKGRTMGNMDEANGMQWGCRKKVGTFEEEEVAEKCFSSDFNEALVVKFVLP